MKLHLLLFVALLSITLYSCSNPGCTDINADNYNASADTDDGSCIYPGCMDPTSDNYDPLAQFEDGSCIPARDKFLGSYTCFQQCGSDTLSHYMTIVSSTVGPLKIIIQNLGDYLSVVSALSTVNGSTVSIDSAVYNNLTFSGLGQIDGNVLTLTYFATDSLGNTNTCTVTATKL